MNKTTTSILSFCASFEGKVSAALRVQTCSSGQLKKPTFDNPLPTGTAKLFVTRCSTISYFSQKYKNCETVFLQKSYVKRSGMAILL